MKSLEHPGLKLIIYGAVLEVLSLFVKGAFGLMLTFSGIVLVVIGLVKVLKK